MERITLALAGDVMTGRGIDQALPHPADPRLWEECVTSAATYVELAERANGPVPRPVDFSYVWGDALQELHRMRPDAWIVNLETSITDSRTPVPKGINYKMSPANLACLVAGRFDCCSLANNHVLDWGTEGLLETLQVLQRTGIGFAGAGRDEREASAPAVIDVAGRGRVLVFSFGCRSSGIPPDWMAGTDKPGINLLPDLSRRTVARIAGLVGAVKRPGDVAVASVHWGVNWGYGILPEERAFAHGLVETGAIDVVHGHSAHHAKVIEVHEGKLILYGCGDFLNDYEGIAGYEHFRGDLALLYVPTLDVPSGRLADLAIVPFQIRNLRLNRASAGDAAWLCATLSREGEAVGTRLAPAADRTLRLAWAGHRDTRLP
jgi:poly-gamma-glutamate capsule biosynthesis protein CapA/YwtB (metallophosphatase superfamily)